MRNIYNVSKEERKTIVKDWIDSGKPKIAQFAKKHDVDYQAIYRRVYDDQYLPSNDLPHEEREST